MRSPERIVPLALILLCLTATHQVHLARTYADRIVALRAGKVVQDAPVGTVDARTPEPIYERNGGSL
jgi:ABC-type phosphate/phosphonate transport system ATPase subunit